MAGFETSGLDDLQSELEQMARKADELNGEHEISFDELFDKSFMRKNTQYSSIDDLLKAGGFHAETNEEFDAIPTKKLDAHIAKVTRFASWEEMLQEATDQYVADQLGF